MFDRRNFPEEALRATVSASPMLNKDKLRTQLSFIYESPDCAESRPCSTWSEYFSM